MQIWPKFSTPRLVGVDFGGHMVTHFLDEVTRRGTYFFLYMRFISIYQGNLQTTTVKSSHHK